MESQVAVEIREDYCSACSICGSLCPFEAIKRDPETGRIMLEIEKCQVCGVCYSSCPASAISTVYYDLDSLVEYLERARVAYDSDTLVFACKGSAPAPEEIQSMFGISRYIPISVPCVGRIPMEFLIRTIATMEISKIYILACEGDYCRFERGSTITARRAMALNLLLDQLGYGREVITLKQNSLKVVVDSNKCIGCGNCVYFCPYDAARLESPGVARFDLDACHGCGLCVALCPAMALELEGWEHQQISSSISRLSQEMKSPKILVFRCQWAVFPPFEEKLPDNVRSIELPCAGRIEPLHILEALHQGVDGIMVVTCAEEDCRMKSGSKEAQRSLTSLKETLNQIGLGERLHVCSAAPRYPETFAQELQGFRESIIQS